MHTPRISRNPKLANRNLKLETQNLQPATRNLKRFRTQTQNEK